MQKFIGAFERKIVDFECKSQSLLIYLANKRSYFKTDVVKYTKSLNTTCTTPRLNEISNNIWIFYVSAFLQWWFKGPGCPTRFAFRYYLQITSYHWTKSAVRQQWWRSADHWVTTMNGWTSGYRSHACGPMGRNRYASQAGAQALSRSHWLMFHLSRIHSLSQSNVSVHSEEVWYGYSGGAS